MKLADIHTKYDTDKGTYHSYIEKYDEIFGPYKDQQLNFLEIGCLTCGSLKMFNEFFTQARIYGMDNWAQNTDHMGQLLLHKGIDLNSIIQDINNNYPKIKLITCDSTDNKQVSNHLNGLNFKFIIDDGDHRLAAQYNTFKNFIPYLEVGGVYIIEDVAEVNELAALINEYINELKLNLRVEVRGWYKGNRVDDAIIIVQ